MTRGEYIIKFADDWPHPILATYPPNTDAKVRLNLKLVCKLESQPVLAQFGQHVDNASVVRVWDSSR